MANVTFYSLNYLKLQLATLTSIYRLYFVFFHITLRSLIRAPPHPNRALLRKKGIALIRAHQIKASVGKLFRSESS